MTIGLKTTKSRLSSQISSADSATKSSDEVFAKSEAKEKSNAHDDGFERTLETPSTVQTQSAPSKKNSSIEFRTRKSQLRMSSQKEIAQKMFPGTPANSVADALSFIGNDPLMSLLRVRFKRAAKKTNFNKTITLGKQYADIGRLVPGQTRISIERVKEKVVHQSELDGFVNDGTGTRPAFDEGRSTLPLTVYKPVVKMPGGKLLVLDGNHQVAASLLAGAQSVPVDVVADLSDLDTDAFFDEAAQKGWTYLNDFGGRSTSVVPSYAELKDDGFRYLLTQTALKAKLLDTLVFEDDTRISSRAWVKLKGPTVDFVEFILADILYRAADDNVNIANILRDGTLTQRASTVRSVLAAAEEKGELDTEALGILLVKNQTFNELSEQSRDAITRHRA